MHHLLASVVGKWIAGLIAAAVIATAFKLWLDDQKDAAVEAAGNEATAEAYIERDEFEAAVQNAVAAVSRDSEAKVERVVERFESFEALMRSDWDADLQNNDDFARRATAATNRVFERRGRRLQAIFAGGIGLPAAAGLQPGADEDG